MKRKPQEWISIQIARHPGRIVLEGILLFDVLFVIMSALIISALSLSGTEKMSFFEAAYYTVTMILDAGCISFVVEDIGTSGVTIVIICLLIITIGMISFTGAVIGYVTNAISGFIENADSNSRKLNLSGHIVILNWNTRASEIINDLLYLQSAQRVVVLVNSRKNDILNEINERLSDTIIKENKLRKKTTFVNPALSKQRIQSRKKFKNKLAVLVREGDVFSSKQLRDICLEKAKTIIILGNDINNSICKYEQKLSEDKGRGNAQIVKTLMQVSDITAADYSDDNQKIVVEITDDWTGDLVNRIIQYKQKKQKCHIVPIRVNKVLGAIFSQLSLMPELNLVYNELFSNAGASFYAREKQIEDEKDYIAEYLSTNSHAIPLTKMDYSGNEYFYYSARTEFDIDKGGQNSNDDYSVNLNHNYWIEQKNIIILGHNSNCKDIMNGFMSFRNEWHYRDKDDEILRVVIIDDEENLKKESYYKQYPFVVETVAAEIYEKELISDTIKKYVSSNRGDTSVLILSDDSVLSDDIDANVLANLVYVQDIINEKKISDPDFDEESIDLVVEIINPKHHDVVSGYSVNNVVISNRYISKMVLQIGEKEALYNFYTDILTYDSQDSEQFDSKEIYVKKVSCFFNEIPKPCTASELVRAVYEASVDNSLPRDKQNPTIPLGYVKRGGRFVLFSGDLNAIKVELEKNDKIIVFSNH